jgi:hypothetical protein
MSRISEGTHLFIQSHLVLAWPSARCFSCKTQAPSPVQFHEPSHPHSAAQRSERSDVNGDVQNFFDPKKDQVV